jgi:hypothetical protein
MKRLMAATVFAGAGDMDRRGSSLGFDGACPACWEGCQSYTDGRRSQDVGSIVDTDWMVKIRRRGCDRNRVWSVTSRLSP